MDQIESLISKNLIAVAMLSYNRHETLKKSVNNVLRCFEGIKLIIVDNNSSDNSKIFLKQVEKANNNVIIHFNECNLGVSGGRNSARLHIDREEYVLFIDEDTFIDRDTLLGMLKVFKTYNRVGAVSPTVLNYRTRLPQNYSGNSIAQVACYHGSCHLLSRAAMDIVGLIDPECTFGGEEIDYSIRLRSCGFKVYVIPTVHSLHDNYVREGVEGIRRRQKRVYNFTRINFKHFPLIMALKNSLRYLLRHIYSMGNQIHWIYCFKLLWYSVKGIYAGIIAHKRIHNEALKFYSNPHLRPDFGNKRLFN